jgi:hypothetical protein
MAVVSFVPQTRTKTRRFDGARVSEVGAEWLPGTPYPAEQRPERKIEAAVALMMAIGRAMAKDTNECDLEGFLRNPAIA